MVGYEGPWLCSEECRQAQICAIANIDYADYHYCIENKGADLKTRLEPPDFGYSIDSL
jgi:Acid sphingomyelin phosphodiesterase C-terminal region